MMDETMDEYTIAYIGNRNAASGKAEAVMVKVDADWRDADPGGTAH